MLSLMQILLVLLVVIAAVAVLASRLQVPPAILLVITGVILALVPGLPPVRLAPEFVLMIVLPPVIYSSAVAMSWREFRFNLRPITQLAIGCVVFTTVAVAAATHWFLGLAWPVGFVVGAIVSPPDAVAPLSIARRMQLPRRILVILEGEGLANDATALILYRFAVVAVTAGVFSFGHAVATFGAVVAGELLWGVGVGWLMLHLRRWVREPRIEILLSVLTPYVAYWPPEHLGGSGVVATVATGLYISWNGLRLIGAETRLQGIFFWDFLMYVTEGMIFLLTGLQAHALAGKLKGGIDGFSIFQLGIAATVVCAVVILTRAIWMYPATYLPRWFSPSLARRDPSPPWQWPFILSFTGVRGIVSLAAALAIPFVTDDGVEFPDRDLILFLTFAVILVTLVGQGLLLPTVIRALGLAERGRVERHDMRAEEFAARRLAIEAAIEQLDELTTARGLPEEIVAPIRLHQQSRLNHVWHRGEDGEAHQRIVKTHDEIERLLISVERDSVNEMYRAGKVKDEARRRIERDLDLREARLTNLLANE
jgi:Na+/H+ antiporter